LTYCHIRGKRVDQVLEERTFQQEGLMRVERGLLGLIADNDLYYW